MSVSTPSLRFASVLREITKVVFLLEHVLLWSEYWSEMTDRAMVNDVFDLLNAFF